MSNCRACGRVSGHGRCVNFGELLTSCRMSRDGWLKHRSTRLARSVYVAGQTPFAWATDLALDSLQVGTLLRSADAVGITQAAGDMA
jgi:hypothetical protein